MPASKPPFWIYCAGAAAAFLLLAPYFGLFRSDDQEPSRARAREAAEAPAASREDASRARKQARSDDGDANGTPNRLSEIEQLLGR